MDLVGQKFGRLTVLCNSGLRDKNRNILWECKCDCGKIVLVSRLTSLGKKSCGCSRTKHGKSYTKIYKIWVGLLGRCHNPNDTGYYAYGAKGITVCDRWREFENFYADMGELPSNNHSIDRIDNKGNYDPSNCRWATPLEQANNRDNNRLIEYQGEIKTIGTWERYLGFSEGMLYRRLIKLNWNIEKAFTTPKRHSANITYNNQTNTIREWESILGFPQGVIYKRLKRGWDIEKAITTSVIEKIKL